MSKKNQKGSEKLSGEELQALNVGHLDEWSLRAALQNFQQLDRDNDGRLSREEFRAGLGMLGVDKTFSTIIFNSFDTGGDGWIDRREFLAAMAVMLHPDNLEDQIDLAFDAYDVNKDGKLDFDELRQVIASVYATMEQMGIGGAEFNADVVANELFRQMDRGAKGYITKEDYLFLARTQPDLIKQVGLGGTGQRRRSRRASSFIDNPPETRRKRGAGPRKRGTTVTFGSAKWELVVQMMLGIRLAVGRAGDVTGSEQISSRLSSGADSFEGSTSPPAGSQPSIPTAPEAAAKKAKTPGRTAGVANVAGSSGSLPSCSTQYEGKESAEATELNARRVASAAHLDRSEPFTILLHKSNETDVLGVVLMSPGEDGLVLLQGLEPDGLAAKSGKLRPGDVILAVNDSDVRGHEAASTALRAAVGEIKLRISGKIDANRLCDEVTKFRIPSHHRGQDRNILFKDYAPQVYRRIRSLFGVSERDYMLSLGPEQIMGELLLGTMGSLSELMSEGKSGSFFYYSNDALYMIKKIPQREMSSLRRLLSAYVRHVEKYPHTLLPRFMGAHRLIVPEIGKVHFVVFANVFSTDRTIHERYDLKGSTQGRTVGAEALKNKSDALRKDLDLKRQFQLGPNREAVLTQIKADVNFLREVQTMDYSLLCGIHFPRRELPPSDDPKKSTGNVSIVLRRVSQNVVPPPMQTPRGEVPIEGGGDAVAEGMDAVLPLRRTAGSVYREASVDPLWEALPDSGIEGKQPADDAEPEIYFIGIIDILTSWSPAKQMENWGKKVMHHTEMQGISCVRPDFYADRFEKALEMWIAPA